MANIYYIYNIYIYTYMYNDVIFFIIILQVSNLILIN